MIIKTFTYIQRDGTFWAPSGQTMDRHIATMMEEGWEPMNSISDAGHVRLGKTLGAAAFTGGLSLLFGGSRTAQTIMITFKNPFFTEPPPLEVTPVEWTFTQVLLCTIVGLFLLGCLISALFK